MEPQNDNLRNDNLRERLLSRLPQPENLPRFQEGTASLLARHERALFWERVFAGTTTCLGTAVLFLAFSPWAHNLGTSYLGTSERSALVVSAALLFFYGAISELRYWVSRSKVDILKEVKQIQLQVLEVQAKLDAGQR